MDKLDHLIRFSDFLLLISGEQGVGKSALLQQIRPADDDSTLACCTLTVAPDTEQEALLDAFLAQLPSHEQGGTGFADKLKLFHLQLKSLQAVGQKCILLIDDAHHLSATALELLLNLHETGAFSGGAQLVLVSNEAFAEKLTTGDLNKRLDGRLHHLSLPRLSDAEIQEYLRQLHPEVFRLPEKKVQALIGHANGAPGRVEMLLAGKKLTPAETKRPRAFPLPLLHMSGIGLVLVGILGLSLWQFFPQSSTPDATLAKVEETVSLPLNVDVAAADNTEAPVVATGPVVSVTGVLAGDVSSADESETENAPSTTAGVENAQAVEQTAATESSSLAKSALAERLKAQEEKLQNNQQPGLNAPAREQGSPTIVNRVATKPLVVAKVEKPALVAVAPATVKAVSKQSNSKKATSKQANKHSADEQAILAWETKGYTLQMLGARSVRSAEKFLAEHNEPKLLHFSTIYKGAPWHVVVYGQYPNRDVANAAVKKLPVALQKVRPWARSVRGVQVDIRKK